jgi:hypothetical protein
MTETTRHDTPLRKTHPMPGGRGHAPREELARLGEEMVTEPGWRARWRRREAVTIVVDWLESFPGDSWQDRWLVKGSDRRGRSRGPAGLTQWSRNRITTGLGVLIVLRAVRPGCSWLLARRLLGVYPASGSTTRRRPSPS